MKQEVGIGIIGTGFARRIQIPAFRACEGANIVSVASGHIDNAKATAKEFGIGHATDDWQETVSHADVDLVCITTPPPLHYPITLAAIAAGKHVLCEKPMAMNADEAGQMAAAAANSSLLTLIDHELRFQPGRLRAYEMLRDGAIGNVRHAKAIFQAPHRGDPNLPWNWWSDAAAGGGALGAIASHVIDTFLWFLDAEISSVFCQLHTHIKERPDRSGSMKEVTSDDESNMMLRFGEGELVSDATGLISISMTEMPSYLNRTEFYGDAGSMRIDQLGELYLAKPGDKDWTAVEVDLGTHIPGVPDTGFSRGFMEFAPLVIEAVAEGRNQLVHGATFNHGLRTQLVLDAAIRSHRSGCTERPGP